MHYKIQNMIYFIYYFRDGRTAGAGGGGGFSPPNVSKKNKELLKEESLQPSPPVGKCSAVPVFVKIQNCVLLL